MSLTNLLFKAALDETVVRAQTAEVERDELRTEVHRSRAEVTRLRSALERVESHGAGYAVTIARDALNAS